MKKTIYWHFPHLKFWMGGTKFLLEVVRRLSKDYNITIVTNEGSEETIRKFNEQGINVVTTSILSTNSILYWLLFPVMFLWDFIVSAWYLRKADYVFAIAYPSNLICTLYGMLSGKKYYYYCYEPFAFFQNPAFIATFPWWKQLLLKLLAFLYGWSDIWASQQAGTTFTLNQITQKMIKKTYNIESIITLMGVDSKHFRHYADNSVQVKLSERIIVTHSTDYSTMKRTDLVIDAVAKLVSKHPSLLLIITSTQPNSSDRKQYEDQVKRLQIEHNVAFSGLLSYEELPLYYSASVCYVSCSYDEMFGTTSSNLPVKEALACETPAIRANITTEDVEDGVSGFLIDPRDTNIMAEKIDYLITHREKAREMGKKGREKIVTLYNWDAVTKVIADAI